MRKKVLRSPRLVRKERRRKARKALALSILLLSFGAVGMYALLQPDFRIQEVTIDGAETLSQERIRDVIRTRLTGTYLGFFPRGHNLFFPAGSLRKALLAEFPLLSGVRFRRDSLASVHMSLIAREPYALWCEEERCFLLDKSGVLFAEAPKGEKSTFPRLAVKDFAAEAALGTAVLEEQQLSALVSLVGALEGMGFAVEEIELGETRTVSVRLREGARLLLAESESYTPALARLTLLLSEEDLIPRGGEQGELRVQYIDLRYGNKVYFKPR